MGVALGGACAAPAADPPASVREREGRRVAVVERIERSTIAVFPRSAESGGSGVLISEDGYALTNFHVVAPCGPRMVCGTSDGRAHRAVLVGVDPTGDIALIRLLGDAGFEPAEIGDSDAVRVGDEAIVAGNPFMLADDFRPSVSVGLISGVGRYQPPADSLLEYADCLQTDAAINPGNSGGPLFDGDGRLIGVVGRGSFEKRGRVNVGFGYAVSINQVMRLVSHLRSGRVVDRATLGATVRTWGGGGEPTRCLVDAVDTRAELYRRGLRPGDELIAIGGHEVRTANEVLNRVRAAPAGWRTRVGFRRIAGGRAETREADVRLGELHAPGELLAAVGRQQEAPSPADEAPAEWSGEFLHREGFANHRDSLRETARLLDAWRVNAGSDPRPWSIAARDGDAGLGVRIEVADDGAAWDSSRGRYRLDAAREFSDQRTPREAPGLLATLWAWRAAAIGAEAVDAAYRLGKLPWEADGPPRDVLRVEHRGAVFDLYFSLETGVLVGLETSLDATRDPLRLTLTEHRSEVDAAGVRPYRWSVARGPDAVTVYDIESYDAPRDADEKGDR